MKFALIGCGRISDNHIKAAKENNIEIIALCDKVKEKALNLKERHFLRDTVLIFEDYKKMLKNVKIDFVAIATDSGSHAEIACFCAENKINFIVEKPMAMSVEDADKIIRTVEDNNVIAAVSHQNRFNIAVQYLHNAIKNNRFGKISHGSINVRWHRDEEYYVQDDWRGKWETDGGTLMNQCIHGIDLLLWMLGEEVTDVFGMTNNAFHKKIIEAEDIGVAVLRFKNGALATIEGTTNCFKDFEQTLTIFGEKGTVKLGGMNANKIDVWDFTEKFNEDTEKTDIEEKAKNVYGNGHTSLYADFADAIRNNRTPYVDVYTGKRAVEIILAVYKSQKTGLPVHLPLNKFSSAEMKGEF